MLVAQAACVGMHLLMNVKSCYIYALTGRKCASLYQRVLHSETPCTVLLTCADDGKLYTTVASVGKRVWIEASAFNFERPLVTISTGSYFVVAANTAGEWCRHSLYRPCVALVGPGTHAFCPRLLQAPCSSSMLTMATTMARGTSP